MLTAKQAFEETTQAIREKYDYEIRQIDNKIQEAVKAGEYSVPVGNISDVLQDYYKILGYNVISNDRGDDYRYELSWRNK